MDLALEWDRHPGTGLRLANELAGTAGPGVAEALGPAPGRLGILAARCDGDLLGWAALTAGTQTTAVAEPVYVSRYVHGIQLGHYDFEPATDAEEALVTELLAGLAAQARALGYRILRWRGTDIGPEGRAAAALGAVAVGEYARVWTAEPRSWRAPMALAFAEPADYVLHSLDESAEPPGQALVVALLTPGSADPAASVAISVSGSAAYIDASTGFTYADVDPGGLAALIGAVITELHDQVPQALVLRVLEHDDQRIRTALATAGLVLTARCRDYELALGTAD